MKSLAEIFVLVPLGLQGVAMVFDEFYFHRKRGLPKWERLGHPLDTLTVIACFLFLIFAPVTEENLLIFTAMAFFSCLFVTKDEFVHTENCEAKENWLHAMLFVLHPLVFLSLGYVWYQHLEGLQQALMLQTTMAFGFLIYQIVYWNFMRGPHDVRQN